MTTKNIIFDVLPVFVLRGALVPAGPVSRLSVLGSNCWEAIEGRWISSGGSYSARRTVAGWPTPYAVVQNPTGWVALYHIEPAPVELSTPAELAEAGYNVREGWPV